MNLFTFQIVYKNDILHMYNTLKTQLHKNLIVLHDDKLFYENLVLYLYNIKFKN